MPRNLPIIVDDDFGPEMRKLPVEEQMFVCMLFATGLTSMTKAAELAGIHSETRIGLRCKAHRLLHKPQVAAAVIEESKRRTVFMLPRAQKALSDMVDNPQHQDHFKAVRMVREESGLAAAVRKVVDHNINITMTDAEKVKKIALFAQTHGIDPKTLLGFNPTEPQDAEFEEVVDWQSEDVSQFA